MRCGHVEKWGKTPCLHRMASGVPFLGPWAKVRLTGVDLGQEEELLIIWGPLAGLSWSGTSTKWAHEITPDMAYNPPQDLYT